MKLKHYFVRHTAALVSDILVPVSRFVIHVFTRWFVVTCLQILWKINYFFHFLGKCYGNHEYLEKAFCLYADRAALSIAIIGVLVGLLLPGSSQAREAARRSACGNKMKQNALAMHTYADANRSLPSGSSRRSEGKHRSNTVWKSFTVELMPFIEMSTVYDQLDLTKSQLDGTGGQNSNWWKLAPVNQGNPIYTAQFCPSDPDSFAGRTVDGKYFGGYAINNNRRSGGRCYDVSLGPIGFPAATPDCPNGQTASWCRANSNWWASGSNPVREISSTPGVFNWSFEFKCEFKDITDGTSNTLLLIERRPGLHQRSAMYAADVGVPTSIRPNSSHIDDTTSSGNNPQRAKIVVPVACTLVVSSAWLLLMGLVLAERYD